MRVVFLIAAVCAIGSVAHAQPAQPRQQPVRNLQVVEACPVKDQIAAKFPGTIIDDCPLTQHGPKNEPEAERDKHDEFTVRGHQPDGTRMEVIIQRYGKVLGLTKITPHSDLVESQGIMMALLFWAFAAASVGGALFVVTRRNLIAAVMGMVGSFMGIAAVYMMLYANFLAVVQMLVYAGAIMVLFVFVIMVLNRPEDEPVAPTGRIGIVIGGGAIIYLVGRLILMLINVKAPESAIAAPPQISLLPTGAGPGKKVDWGGVEAVGNDLFGNGLFVFEAISILLLIAVVGAIAIARPHGKGDSEGPGIDGGTP
jgi:NADH-quinone oxidoreductase subunit J